MDKVISVTNKVIIKKMVELPIHIAAEVLASFCKEGGCIMNRYSTDCPFKDKMCVCVYDRSRLGGIPQ